MSDTTKKPAAAPGAAPIKKTTASAPAPKSTTALKVGAPTTGSASTTAAKVSSDPKTEAASTVTGSKPAASTAQPSSAPAPESIGVASDKSGAVTGQMFPSLSDLQQSSPNNKETVTGTISDVTLDNLKTVETTEIPAEETDEQLATKNKNYQDQVKKGNFTKGASKEAAIEETAEPIIPTNGAESLVSIEGAIKALRMSPKGSTIVADGDIIEKVANCGEDWKDYGFEVDNQLIQTNPYGFYIK